MSQYTIWAHLHRLECDKAKMAAAAGRALLWEMHISHLYCEEAPKVLSRYKNKHYSC